VPAAGAPPGAGGSV